MWNCLLQKTTKKCLWIVIKAPKKLKNCQLRKCRCDNFTCRIANTLVRYEDRADNFYKTVFWTRYVCPILKVRRRTVRGRKTVVRSWEIVICPFHKIAQRRKSGSSVPWNTTVVRFALFATTITRIRRDFRAVRITITSQGVARAFVFYTGLIGANARDILL